MNNKIIYQPLAVESKQIAELIKNERFRNREAFLDRAVRILLKWELDPKNSMEIMKEYPQTEEQKQILQVFLAPTIYQANFGSPVNNQNNENQRLKDKLKSKDDFIKLKENLPQTREFIEKLKISDPNNLIQCDDHPILFRFYTRFAPGKIVLSVLADLLRKNSHTDKIDLENLRVESLDIATEVATEIIMFEETNRIKKNKKVSTGFPKINDDMEQQVSIHKRFRDQYVGKIRRERNKDRQKGEEYFEGILGSLGLINVTRGGDRILISLTQKGKEFYLLDNPILNGNYSQGLSVEESDYINENLIPPIILEKKFYDSALKQVEKIQNDSKLEIKTIELIEKALIDVYENYISKNPDKITEFNFKSIGYHIDSQTQEKVIDDVWARYIEGWRVAVMGRLTELHKIEWIIQPETGKSIYKIKGT